MTENGRDLMSSRRLPITENTVREAHSIRGLDQKIDAFATRFHQGHRLFGKCSDNEAGQARTGTKVEPRSTSVKQQLGGIDNVTRPDRRDGGRGNEVLVVALRRVMQRTNVSSLSNVPRETSNCAAI